ncbi:uncharacterized protein BJX67DRAFT_339916 [Aspergillus lucknowensis]|uniref:Uncharacterized protein n=1 Tax=Aspergillus lucknowensis TaxID=176173 RepID=A0ABR4M7S9_9EURO
MACSCQGGRCDRGWPRHPLMGIPKVDFSTLPLEDEEYENSDRGQRRDERANWKVTFKL